jgi:TrwC relaxase
VSVVVSIAKGADASYPWRQIGTSGGADHTGKPGVGYYLSPSLKGGEPPGRWVGEGAAELGFHDGEIVQREPFERLYGQFIDPRDPTGQTRLGRAPQRFQPVEEIYTALLAAEPEATAERRAELLHEAKSKVRTPTHYWDTTFSVGKSVSLLHASALVNAMEAGERGALEEAARWGAVAGEIWECIQIGNRVFIDYLQREAGYTRTGYHGRKTDGTETGRWEDAHQMVVAMFAQHTSRDGEPQLHIHNLWLNRVKTQSDGRWRAPDGAGFFAHKGAGAALAAFAMESELSRRAGIRWVYRPGSHGREINGVPESLMKLFSSRRVSINTVTARLAREFEAQHGYAPDQRALHSMRQFANHLTRQGKKESALDFAALRRQWEAQARGAEAGALQGLARRLWRTHAGAARGAEPGRSEADGAGSSGADQQGTEPDRVEPAARALTPAEERDIMARGLAQLQERKTVWRLPALIWCVGEQLPDHAGAESGRAAAAQLESLAARVLAGEAGREVLCLEAPEWPRVPDRLRRADGRSVYKPHWTAEYTTKAQLTLEERLLLQAQQNTAPRLAPDVAAKLLGADQALLEAQLHAQAQQARQAQAQEQAGDPQALAYAKSAERAGAGCAWTRRQLSGMP